MRSRRLLSSMTAASLLVLLVVLCVRERLFSSQSKGRVSVLSSREMRSDDGAPGDESRVAQSQPHLQPQRSPRRANELQGLVERMRSNLGRSRFHPLDMPLAPDDGAPVGPPPLERGPPSEFYFTRIAYSGYFSRGYGSWSVDYPKADRQFLIGLRRLADRLDAYEYENPILLTDPDLRRYPFLYAVEVGFMGLSAEEAKSLREYLLTGGFLVIDDFWGSREWANLEAEMEQILPGVPIVDISLDHPIFHCFYDVREIVQVPNVGIGRRGGPTFEQDGIYPAVRGVFDERGRLLVVINWNSDLGDAWEWAEDPQYPLRFSTYAYQMGVNFIVYAMSH